MMKTTGFKTNSNYIPVNVDAYRTIDGLKNASRAITAAGTRVNSQLSTNGQILAHLKGRLQS